MKTKIQHDPQHYETIRKIPAREKHEDEFEEKIKENSQMYVVPTPS